MGELEWQMFKFSSHFNMRASYIDQNEVAQICTNTIAVWKEVILKFVPTSTCFCALLNAHVHFSFSPQFEPNHSNAGARPAGSK